MPTDILEKARRITLLVLDVDGVLSDGKLYYANSGEEFKAFSTLDGLGIKLLQNAGIEVAIITGRQSAIVSRRAQELGIEKLYQGNDDKLTLLQKILEESGKSFQETAYIGDDLPDLACIRRVEFSATVPNAHPLIHEYALCCTKRAGGDGAVREICDLILRAQDKFDQAIQPYL
ncbi:MAG: 3-deoxy-manno-octulosonate-8-phosphatase KdsC [Gammaproteobacteria bacterium]|nr:3-deoxy-manno-octulosonate-8-phosphatase KdsC [Gammaproteobacteria bacterium]MAY02327.1 3-deoxy-manno-octulosonate-8-phosphatase KdsC [Gammaproteobacteria bacterium]